MKRATRCNALLLSTAITLSAAPLFAQALPGHATVSAGSASVFNTNYPAGIPGGTTTVTQTTPKVVINWSSFNTNPSETVIFNQPSASAIALNKINGGPTTFNGNLFANGKVWLLNSQGILFSPIAQVNVNSLLATTSTIADSDFMAGNYKFTPGAPNSYVYNMGHITVAQAGLATLVAPGVYNSGTITAKLGKIKLASGDTFTLDLNGDGLISLAASPAMTAQAIQNTGTLDATGGTIAITAAQASKVVDSLINLDGVNDAVTFTGTNNGGDVEFGGKYVNPNAGSFTLTALRNITVDKNASIGSGGKVNVTLDSDAKALSNGSIYLAPGTTINSGGGNITLGGGTNPLTGYAVGNNAPGTDINDGTSIYTNGVDIESNSIQAMGGNIVINGKGLSSPTAALTNGGLGINAGWYGTQGPQAILSTSGTGTITLNGIGGNISAQPGDQGDSAGVRLIYATLSADKGAINITGTGGNNKSVGAYIGASTGVFTAGTNITTNSGAINVTGKGDITGISQMNSEGLNMYNGSISSVSGPITLKGYNGLSTDIGVNTAIYMVNDKVSSSLGNITITGLDYPGNTMYNSIGVYIYGSTISSTGVGAGAAKIDITGSGRNPAVFVYGDSTISTVDGNVTLTGMGSVYVDPTSHLVSTGKGTFQIVD